MSQLGFVSCINKPTYNNKTCIGHIFIKTKYNANSLSAIILNSKITDHSPTFLQIKNNLRSKEGDKSSIKYKSYIDYDKLCQNLNAVDWSVVDSTDVDTSIQFLTNTIKHNVNLASNKIRIRNYNKRKPWITPGI